MPPSRQHNLLDLPNEILYIMLDLQYLLPHEQSGFTCASRQALAISSSNLQQHMKNSTLEKEKDITSEQGLYVSATGRWIRAFREQDREVQEAIERTKGVLPCPNLFSDLPSAMLDLLLTASRATRAAEAGDRKEMEGLIVDATAIAKAADVPTPNFVPLWRNFWPARMSAMILEASERASTGNKYWVQLCIDEASKAAQKAGLPPPDFTAIWAVLWPARVAAMMREAENRATEGDQYWMMICLDEAVEAAQQGGLVRPNVEAIESVLREQGYSNPFTLADVLF